MSASLTTWTCGNLYVQSLRHRRGEPWVVLVHRGSAPYVVERLNHDGTPRDILASCQTEGAARAALRLLSGDA